MREATKARWTAPIEEAIRGFLWQAAGELWIDAMHFHKHMPHAQFLLKETQQMPGIAQEPL